MRRTLVTVITVTALLVTGVALAGTGRLRRPVGEGFEWRWQAEGDRVQRARATTSTRSTARHPSGASG